MNYRSILIACSKYIYVLLMMLPALAGYAQTAQKADNEITTDKLSYHLSNDRDSLYLNINTTDSLLQRNILGSGITFTLNAGGAKSITFPVNEKTDEGGVIDAGRQQLQLKALLTQYRKISVSGFAGIHDELLSARNFYGIRVAIVYDDNNNSMSYTLTIPLKLLQTGSASNNEWPFSIKVNRLERTVIKYLYSWLDTWGHNTNGNYMKLTQLANSESSKSLDERLGDAYLNKLKAGTAKFVGKDPDGFPTFSTLVIPLTRNAKFSGKYVLQ